MTSNDSLAAIWDALKQCKRVAMTLHYSPDGDSVGSCTAMKYVLERDLGVDVTLVSFDPVEDNLRAFAQDVQFGTDLSDLSLKDYDAVVCLDAGSPGMLSGKQKGTFTVPSDVNVIQMDHHATNSYYGTLNYVDTNCPSACSVLVEFFRSMNVRFDAELSKRLLLGICTDTGFFGFATNPGMSFEHAAFLVSQGVDYYNDISKPIRFGESLHTKQLFALVVLNMRVNTGQHFAYSSISLAELTKFTIPVTEVRATVRALQDLKGMDFVFTLVETPEFIKGSFRSSTNVDVSLFAKALGGGGHKPAAAFQLPRMPLADAEKQVLDVIERVGIQRY